METLKFAQLSMFVFSKQQSHRGLIFGLFLFEINFYVFKDPSIRKKMITATTIYLGISALLLFFGALIWSKEGGLNLGIKLLLLVLGVWGAWIFFSQVS